MRRYDGETVRINGDGDAVDGAIKVFAIMVLFVMIYLWRKGRMVGNFYQEEWKFWRLYPNMIVIIDYFIKVKIKERYLENKIVLRISEIIVSFA